MNMVRHDRISEHLMTAFIQQFKEIINFIVGIGNLNQAKPLVTSKSDKVNTGSLYWFVDRHISKMKKDQWWQNDN